MEERSTLIYKLVMVKLACTTVGGNTRRG